MRIIVPSALLLLGLVLASIMQVRGSEPTPSPGISLLDIEKLSKGEIIAAAAIQGLANRISPGVFLRQTNHNWLVSFSYYKCFKQRIAPETLAKYPSADFFWVDYYSKNGVTSSTR